jgi:hypothetical protein
MQQGWRLRGSKRRDQGPHLVRGVGGPEVSETRAAGKRERSNACATHLLSAPRAACLAIWSRRSRTRRQRHRPKKETGSSAVIDKSPLAHCSACTVWRNGGAQRHVDTAWAVCRHACVDQRGAWEVGGAHIGGGCEGEAEEAEGGVKRRGVKEKRCEGKGRGPACDIDRGQQKRRPKARVRAQARAQARARVRARARARHKRGRWRWRQGLLIGSC